MLLKTRHLHFVGIGGIGMSGIAELLLNLGYEVSGSDLRASPVTQRLEELGGTVFIGHKAGQAAGAHVVITSSAVRADNPEVVEAHHNNIPVIPRAEMLAELMRMKHGIAVAGSHGKTTTTSILGTVLEGAGLDPTVVIGGRLEAWGTNARLGRGDYLVAEADESDGSFLRLSPSLAIVTNIDAEHMDHYRDFDELRQSFLTFLNNLPFYGAGIVCLDDPTIQEIIPQITRRLVTYGFSSQADIRAADVVVQADGTSFACFIDQQLVGKVRLRLHGRHNALNALAAIGIARELDVDFQTVTAALAEFGGTDRRMQRISDHNDILVIDDYGHHPTEIRAVLSTARDAWDRRTIVCFQPHRYSRSQMLKEEFGRAFYQADAVYVLPIYAAGEEPAAGIDSEALATSIIEHGHKQVHNVGSLEEATDTLAEITRPGDLVITLGAGDVWKVARDLAERIGGGASTGGAAADAANSNDN